MITLTNQDDINAAFAKATSHQGAHATGRCLPSQWEQENCQEWSEACEIDGVQARIYYMFENTECEYEDAGDYPWNADHVSKIEIAEQDEDGDYEAI